MNEKNFKWRKSNTQFYTVRLCDITVPEPSLLRFQFQLFDQLRFRFHTAKNYGSSRFRFRFYNTVIIAWITGYNYVKGPECSSGMGKQPPLQVTIITSLQAHTNSNYGHILRTIYSQLRMRRGWELCSVFMSLFHVSVSPAEHLREQLDPGFYLFIPAGGSWLRRLMQQACQGW